MRRQSMSGLAASALAVGLLIVGPQARAEPGPPAVIRGGPAAAGGLLRQRATPGVVPGAGRPYAYRWYRGMRRADLGRARRLRFRRRSAPFTYYYYAPPVGSYYAAPSGNYYTVYHRRRRHHRYRMRIAGYRAYYTRTPPGWHHGRKRGWRGRPVPPGLYR